MENVKMRRGDRERLGEEGVDKDVKEGGWGWGEEDGMGVVWEGGGRGIEVGGRGEILRG